VIGYVGIEIDSLLLSTDLIDWIRLDDDGRKRGAVHDGLSQLQVAVLCKYFDRSGFDSFKWIFLHISILAKGYSYLDIA